MSVSALEAEESLHHGDLGQAGSKHTWSHTPPFYPQPLVLSSVSSLPYL